MNPTKEDLEKQRALAEGPLEVENTLLPSEGQDVEREGTQEIGPNDPIQEREDAEEEIEGLDENRRVEEDSLESLDDDDTIRNEYLDRNGDIA